MASKKKGLTPLQIEAQRIEDEKRRRQEALKAAQQYSLRGAIERKKAAAAKNGGDEPAPTAPAVPDFDAVRQAMHDERHRDSRKSGSNPRYVASLDDRGGADDG